MEFHGIFMDFDGDFDGDLDFDVLMLMDVHGFVWKLCRNHQSI